MFATMTKVDYTLIIAIVLFCVAGLLYLSNNVAHPRLAASILAFGLAVFALAFIINP